MIDHFLALSAIEKALAILALFAVPPILVLRLLAKRKRLTFSIGGGNGDAEAEARPAKTSSTARLEAMELEWRRDVEGEIRDAKRQLFEPEGAVRRGDHNVRNDMAVLILEEEKKVGEQFRELKGEIREMRREFGKMREDLARHGNCCEHCP